MNELKMIKLRVADPVEFTFEETKFQLVGTAVEFVCYSVSTGTMTAQWAGKERALTEEDYEKTESATINGFTMDRLVLLIEDTLLVNTLCSL